MINSHQMDLNQLSILANIPISDTQKTTLSPQLSEVLFYVEKMQKLDLQGVVSTSQSISISNITREDMVAKSPIEISSLVFEVPTIINNE